jgi:hypothetical protein
VTATRFSWELQRFWKSWTFKRPDTLALSLAILGATGHDQISYSALNPRNIN